MKRYHSRNLSGLMKIARHYKQTHKNCKINFQEVPSKKGTLFILTILLEGDE